MKRILTTLATALGLWMLISFTGVIADGARPEFWTTSLMWSILASIVIAPFYAFMNAEMFGSTDEDAVAADEEVQSESTAPAFTPGTSDAPPTRALDLSSISKWAPEEEEKVSA